ncbi:hypothetical protein [Chryseosolibacter indicus]|uniref:Thiamine pyrophosphokinase n=1 Tax=Chryseosolibacter indicus TaxID=2782351 RepID=A0ABS5VKN0_9BACT|nr:hypothetical protein [Chryseosolibacter indicus]MBT1701998.1 hypothetical protein [Chryseosolibacter indicus]
MSSHHFVKEGQEPALIIASPIKNIDEVGDFLEWAPQIIVLHDELDSVLQCGIKADVIITSTANPNDLEKELWHQSPVKVLKAPSKTEELATAIYFLVSQRQYMVNIWAKNTAYYLEELEEIADQMEASLINGVVKWSFAREAFKKWFPENAHLKIKGNGISVTEGEAELVNNEILVKKEGFLSLKAENPFWVGQFIN